MNRSIHSVTARFSVGDLITWKPKEKRSFVFFARFSVGDLTTWKPKEKRSFVFLGQDHETDHHLTQRFWLYGEQGPFYVIFLPIEFNYNFRVVSSFDGSERTP